MAAELERQRTFYNAAHQERQDAYRWACGQAALLGLARPSKTALSAIEVEPLDPKQRKAHAALLAWRAPDAYSQKASMTLGSQRAFLGEIVHDAASLMTRWTIDRLEAAWQAFFARCAKGQTPGFPSYRSMNRWRSFGCSELSDTSLVRPTGKVIGSRALGFQKVPNLTKPLAVRMHRMLPEGAKICSGTFTRAGGRWTVALACRIPVTHGCETNEQLLGIMPDEIVA